MSEFQSFNQIQGEERLNFSGSRYDFCLTYGQTCLEIKATLQGSSESSCINTLNFILGAFDIDPESSNAESPEWSGTEVQIQTWVQTAESLFSNQLFLQSLEKALDEDRQQGEWEEN